MSKISEIFGFEMVIPFLSGDNSPEAQQYAAEWMYANYGALAHSEFFRRGRGILVGPFAKGPDGLPMDCGRLAQAIFETGENWAVSASYLTGTQEDFIRLIPEGPIEKTIMSALNSYDPELEVPMILVREGQPRILFPGFRSEAVNPQELYKGMKQMGTGETTRPRERSQAVGERWKALKYTPTFVPLAAR